MGELYCVPLGATLRGSFCEKVRAAAGQGVLVLPSGILQRAVREEYGINCLGMDVLAARILNKNGYLYLREINRRSQEIVTQELLEYLLEAGKLNYFRQLAQKQGFVKALASLLGELARSGATEKEIAAAVAALHGETGGQAAARDEELVLLYSLYRHYLRSGKWFDLEGKYRLAIKVLQGEQPQLPWQQVYFSDFYRFDPLQLEFLKALDRHCQLTIGLNYEAKRPEVFGAVQNSYAFLAGFCKPRQAEPGGSVSVAGQQQALRLLSENWGGAAVRQAAAGDTVRCLHFPSREREMRWVLADVKRLLRAGVAAGEILVTARTLKDYSGLRRLADEYGIPVTLPHTADFSAQPLAAFVLLLFTAAAGGRAGAEAYFSILSSAVGKLLFTADTEAAAALRLQKYYLTPTAVQEDWQARQEQPDAVLALTDALLAALPPRAPVGEYVRLLLQFVQQLSLPEVFGRCYQEGRIGMASLKSGLCSNACLAACLERLAADYAACGLEQQPVTLAEARTIFRDAFAGQQFILESGRADGVMLTEAFNVQGLRHNYVYLMGMGEGKFPAAATENWLYDDPERARLTAMGIDLRSTPQALAEEAYLFATAAAQAGQQLTLSFSEDDAAEASAYLEQTAALFTDVQLRQAAAADYASPGELLALGPRCDAGWRAQIAGAEALVALAADARRREDGPYNGQLSGTVAAGLAAAQLGSAFSASALEVYAACPFKFLGERVWRQEEFSEKSETAAAVDEGNILHDTLALFLGRYLRQRLPEYAFAVLQQQLLADFAAVSDAYAAKNGCGGRLFWRAELGKLRNQLLQWLHYEYREQQAWQFLPMAVEWEFGAYGSQALCLRLPDGGSVSLVGRIDRIDSDGHRLFITDYKRSAVPAARDLEAGLDLQLPVYMLAANASFGRQLRVAGGGYLSLKEGERKASLELEDLGAHHFKAATRKALQDYDWQAFQQFSEKLLTEYLSGIRSGDFRVRPRKTCSAYCPMRTVCRLQRGSGGEQDG